MSAFGQDADAGFCVRELCAISDALLHNEQQA